MKRTELEQWLNVTHTADAETERRHTWCRQVAKGQWRKHLPSIVSYLEKAHADAREYFHSVIGLSLDPVLTSRKEPAYPQDMPLKTKKGFFGEALCGMFTEAMEIGGESEWLVPTFLFRMHREAEEHLFRLVMKEKVPVDIPGRTGSDFIAIAIGKNGTIRRFLSGEAKCHETFNITKCKEFLKEIGEEGVMPVSVPQLLRILQDQTDKKFAVIIAALEGIFLAKQYANVPKTNLFLYLYDKPGVVNYETPRITNELTAESYNSTVRLHVLEVCIPDGTELVETVYGSLYQGENANVTV
jgi:hypothetical protein